MYVHKIKNSNTIKRYTKILNLKKITSPSSQTPSTIFLFSRGNSHYLYPLELSWNILYTYKHICSPFRTHGGLLYTMWLFYCFLKQCIFIDFRESGRERGLETSISLKRGLNSQPSGARDEAAPTEPPARAASLLNSNNSNL